MNNTMKMNDEIKPQKSTIRQILGNLFVKKNIEKNLEIIPGPAPTEKLTKKTSGGADSP